MYMYMYTVHVHVQYVHHKCYLGSRSKWMIAVSVLKTAARTS